MRRLPETVKRRIVEHLACYRTHAETVDLIAEEFRLTLTPRHIRVYDPMSFQFAGSPRWLDYYQTVRKRCQQEAGDVAIVSRLYRLRRLDQIHNRAMQRGDLARAQSALEQAAKEVGNFYIRS